MLTSFALWLCIAGQAERIGVITFYTAMTAGQCSLTVRMFPDIGLASFVVATPHSIQIADIRRSRCRAEGEPAPYCERQETRLP